MRYLIKLTYDGTSYHGWQIQPNAVTVQGVIHAMLNEIFELPMETNGCGRTDTGVHASMYYAHFDCEVELDEYFIRRANFILPQDIRILNIYKVGQNFNARFDAISRSYKYVLNFAPNPFISKYSLLLHKKPDFEAMNSAAKELLNHTTFGCFSKTGADNKTDICFITEAIWREAENDTWVFHITADRFLRGMVRAIVGTLLLIGFGKISEEEFMQIIKSNDRSKAGESVEARGLFLCDIKYPKEKIIQSI